MPHIDKIVDPIGFLLKQKVTRFLDSYIRYNIVLNIRPDNPQDTFHSHGHMVYCLSNVRNIVHCKPFQNIQEDTL